MVQTILSVMGSQSDSLSELLDIRCIPLIKNIFRLRRTRANSGIQRISSELHY